MPDAIKEEKIWTEKKKGISRKLSAKRGKNLGIRKKYNLLK